MTPTGPELALAEQIALAREPLLVRGAGTKSGMLRPVQAAATISTAGLTGITLYQPKELIISALAGTPVAKVEDTLAERGTQTLGGIAATNLSGPRRVAWGAMRDHIMGMRAVTGRAEVIHSGGRVLKNVTGLDLCKLLTGSHGTLAVITEITLKVLPAPEATGTVMIRGLDANRGVAALSAGLGSPFSVSAACWLPDGDAVPGPAHAGSATLLRIEDFAPSVAYRTERLRADMTAFGPTEILDDATSRAVWRAVRDAVPLRADPAEAVWRLSVRPSAGADALRAAGDAGVHGFLDWGGGLVWLAGPADIATHDAIAALARAAHGTWTLLRAPEAMRAAVEVMPPEPEPLARITRRVKAAFDPRGILNPGRFHAGL